MVESGHESLDWPDAEKQRYADEHQGGWGEYLDRLAALLGKRQSGVTVQADDELWSAIADPSRRRVLDLLVGNGEVSASWLAVRVPFSRQAVSKHLVVLERAGLISRRKHGREVLYQVEADRLDQATRAMAELAAQWDRRLDAIKRLAETAHAEAKKRRGTLTRERRPSWRMNQRERRADTGLPPAANGARRGWRYSSRRRSSPKRSDELARQRAALPWVPVDKDYTFATEAGEATLDDLFSGRSQLIVYHLMFGPDWTEGCPSCSAIADGFEGIRAHLENHDVSLVAVSRAPLDRLLAYRDRMGWTFPWASSLGSDFNYDFHVSIDPDVAPVEYNYRSQAELEARDVSWKDWIGEQPGMSGFVRDGGRCSTPTPPTPGASTRCGGRTSGSTGRRSAATRTGYWWRLHDEYER